ncbi:MAG: thiol-disulfide isomerase, partial [Bryobacteraceae bacterium]
VVFIRPPESKWLRGEAEPGIPFVPPRKRADGGLRSDISGENGQNEILTIFTPGMVPDIWAPGVAKRIPAGSDLVFQIHYTPNGKAVEDQGKIGLVFAKQPPALRALTLMPANLSFKIPPGDPDYKVETKVTLPNGATILSLFPHMHLRGKAFEYRVTYPDGRTETLLQVPKYDFHWQLSYKLEKPVVLPPGTRFECTAWFDNSPNNPWNPDPTAEVRWGEQTREEMMIGFVDVEMPANMNVRQLFSSRKPRPGD